MVRAIAGTALQAGKVGLHFAQQLGSAAIGAYVIGKAAKGFYSLAGDGVQWVRGKVAKAPESPATPSN